MSLPYRLLLLICVGSVLFLTACLMNNTIPELKKPPGAITIDFTSPSHGEILSPTRRDEVRFRISGIVRHPADFQVLLNDSLLVKRVVDRLDYVTFQEYFTPGRWAAPDSPLVVKVQFTNAVGTIHLDSVITQIEPYFQGQPELIAPAHGHFIINDLGSPVELDVEPFDDSESYSFCVATDSLFTDAVYFSTVYSSFDFTPQASGYFYWRVKAIGDLDMESPWSETRQFGLMQQASYSSEFQGMSRIERVVQGETSYYLLGTDGNFGAIMKLDDQVARMWKHTFTFSSTTEVVDCDELDDSSLYVAVQDNRYSSRDDRVFHLTGDGQETWSRILDDYPSISSIRAASSDELVVGFFGNYGAHVAMMDTSLTEAWEFVYGTTAKCRRLTGHRSDGKFHFLHIGGNTYGFGEIDLLGNVNWQHSVNIASNGLLQNYTLLPLADGDFIVGSTVQRYSVRDYIFLLKSDSSGVLAWQHHINYDTSKDWELGAVREHPDGSLYVAGTVQGSSYSSRSDAFLARLSGSGVPQWHKTFGTENLSEYGKDLMILDDRIILFGYQDGGSTGAPLAIQMGFEGNPILD